jgi:hypothetical protein
MTYKDAFSAWSDWRDFVSGTLRAFALDISSPICNEYVTAGRSCEHGVRLTDSCARCPTAMTRFGSLEWRHPLLRNDFFDYRRVFVPFFCERCGYSSESMTSMSKCSLCGYRVR